MIQLTRLNNQPFAVNSDLIKFIENAPDTVVTLTSGEKIVVLETPELVIEKVIAFRRALLAGSLSAGVDPDAAAANLKARSTEQHSHPASENASRG
ncbi:MAG: flagellar FlbD family protein [Terriglobales bacterium]